MAAFRVRDWFSALWGSSVAVRGLASADPMWALRQIAIAVITAVGLPIEDVIAKLAPSKPIIGRSNPPGQMQPLAIWPPGHSLCWDAGVSFCFTQILPDSHMCVESECPALASTSIYVPSSVPRRRPR
jgi:hypothetical protein